jgi:hypothetical protein
MGRITGAVTDEQPAFELDPSREQPVELADERRGSSTVPLPMTMRVGAKTPEGMCCSAWRLPPKVTVWPAFGPP